MNETEIRERLHAVAADAPAPTTVPRTVLRRARTRIALTVGASAAIVVAVIAGSAVGLRQLAAPEPRPATPRPAPATSGSLAYGVDGDIYVAESDGSNAVRIVDGRPLSECAAGEEYWGEGSIWSPDGRYLAFRHASCDPPADSPRRSNVVITDPEGNVLAEFHGEGWDIGWSPDSTRVAVWADLVEGAIGVFGVDGVRQALLTVPPELRPACDCDPMWSPDGESLLVRDVVVPIDGSTPYQLPSPDRAIAEGTFSPDGSRVAYPTRRSLVVAEADGSNAQVVFDGWGSDAVWSPTGDRIAFTSGSDTVNQLRVVDLATGAVTLLAEADGSETEPYFLLSAIDFSPEGDRILFSRADEGVESLWSINADGSDLRRLVAGTGWGDWLSPSPTP